MVQHARRHRLAGSIARVLLVGAAAVARAAAGAGADESIVVTNCDDSGAGSLRAALAAVPEGGVVDLTQLACSTISLTTGALEIVAPGIGIVGPGADRLAIDAGRRSRVIGSAPGHAELVVRGVTVRNGKADGGDGGCIDAAGSLTLNDVVVEDCEASASGAVRGGGVHAGSALTLDHSRISGSRVRSEMGNAYGGGADAQGGATIRFSTLSGNTARSATAPYKGSGGGLMAEASSTVSASTFEGNAADFGGGVVLLRSSNADRFVFSESTISGNSATRTGGIVVKGATAFRGSTIAFNCAAATEGGKYASGIGLNAPTASAMTANGVLISGNGICAGMGTDTAYDVGGFGAGLSGSHNLVQTAPAAFALPADTLRVDPMLLPIAENGGPTRTHALAAGSRAIDAGGDDAGAGFDQRGDGAQIAGAMTDPRGHGARDPRRAAWTSRIAGAHADIGAYEVQSTGTTRTVTHCGDNGDGSFRAAVEGATSGDRIDLASVQCAAIYLKRPVVVTAGNLEIVGPGAERLVLAPDDPVGRPHRLITHAGSGTLSVSGLTLADGQDVETGASSARGGCIQSQSFVRGSDLVFQSCRASASDSDCAGGAVSAAGARFETTTFAIASCEAALFSGGGAIDAPLLSLTDSRVSRATTVGGPNRPQTAAGVAAGEAGCIRSTLRARLERTTLDLCTSAQYASGTFASLDLVNSTVWGGRAAASGGGLYAVDAIVANSTITGNTHADAGSAAPDGLYTRRWARVDSTIIHGNGLGAGGDIGGGAIAGAHNLIGSSSVDVPPDTLTADPRLGPIAFYGGYVPTMAPAAGSMAIDRGSNPLGLGTDARGEGFPRSAGAAPDIGAYEVQGAGGDLIFENGFDA